MKAQLDENAGRILLGDNTGGGVACCGRSGCSVLEVGFQLGSLVYAGHIECIFNSILRKIGIVHYLIGCKYCVNHGVSVHPFSFAKPVFNNKKFVRFLEPCPFAVHS